MRPKYPQKRKPALTLLLAALVFVLGGMATFAFLFKKDNPSATGGEAAASALKPSEEYPRGELSPSLVFDSLLLEKSRRRLTAFSRGKPVRVYLVALGEVPVGPKEYQGDKKTPEGKYIIDDKNPNSAYYKNLGVSYPSQADRERAAKLRKSPGGDIKIHGLAPQFSALGAAHRLTDWTYGCIAVTNPEMEELFARTAVGTPIEIRP